VAAGNKRCSVCGTEKHLKHFDDGRTTCRSCKHLRRRERASGSLEGFLQMRLASLKQRHRQKKFEGTTVSLEYLVALYEQQRGICAISGIPMHITTDQSDLSVSVDRIDINKGYVEDNIRLVCTRINLMRSTLNDHDFLWWCRAMVNSSGN
jgi:hypothetical protein